MNYKDSDLNNLWDLIKDHKAHGFNGLQNVSFYETLSDFKINHKKNLDKYGIKSTVLENIEDVINILTRER